MSMFDDIRNRFAGNITHDPVKKWAGQDLNGGSSPPNNQNNQNNQNNNNQNNNQNNNVGGNNQSTDPNRQNDTGNDAAVLKDLWSDKPVEKKGDQQQQPNNQQPNNQGPQKTAQEQVDDHFKSIGLEPIKLNENEVVAYKENPQGLLDMIQTRVQKSYIEAIKGSKQLVDTAVEAAVKKALDSSRGMIEGKELQGLLRAKYSWAADPTIAPIAETVMQRFLDKGQTRDVALENVGKYFNHLGRTMNPDFVPREPNGNTNENYNRSPQKPDGDTNWLALLQG